MKKILLPILPKYVRKIIEGTKLVEYRKKIRKDTSVNQVLIYQSNDVKKIVAEFCISGVIEGTPLEVWNQTKNVGGIDRKAYFKYFAGKEKAYAYKISNLQIFEKPIPLEKLGIRNPPQSFLYLEVNSESQCV